MKRTKGETYSRRRLRCIENGKFDNAKFFLGLAPLIFFAKGGVEKVKEAGEIALKRLKKQSKFIARGVLSKNRR